MAEASLEQLLDIAKFEAFIDANVPGSSGPLEVKKHVAGFSNETFFVTRGNDKWVMRRPPRGPLLPTAHDVIREYRYISALHGHARVPRPIVACEDPEVIGAPFYLMERKDGVVIRAEMPPAYDTPQGRRKVAEEIIAALVELHAVDYEAVGLGGKGDTYLQRQVERWAKQWELTRPRTRELPGLDAVTDWLRARIPEAGGVSVVHGDYKLDNVIYAKDEPRLLAILDWEMATLGDPLADLGWLLSNWGDPGDPPGTRARVEGLRVTDLEGMPTIAEMVALYEQMSGRSMKNFAFYHVLAVYKMAIILEGLYMHYVEKTASNPASADFEWYVPVLVDRMHRLMGE
ncbi:MAG TPA: phosphotransferase family protein [Tepidiformaceae bacterium]|nr:phosphotransferase family protein [Tepidiformaceae bacterium]